MQNISDKPKDIALVLAAGKGTRMLSSRPKVLLPILGSPMLAYVLKSLSRIFLEDILIVAGCGEEQLKEAFPDAWFVSQPEQLGTGDALKSALPALEEAGAAYVTVVNGDVPLISPADIEFFIANAGQSDIAFATILLQDPGTYGRVIRKNGQIRAVVERKDYDPDIYGEPSGEVNAGLYRIKTNVAKLLVPELENNNKSGEYYITDLIGLGIRQGLDVRGVPCGDNINFMGINTPAELSRAEDLLARGISRKLLESGVMIHDSQMLRASPFATIEPGSTIWAPCCIYGQTQIHAGAEVGFCCQLVDSEIESGASILPFSHIEKARIGKNAVVGPYARIRPGSEISANAHIGNFVELKNTRIGLGAKANHLSYIGDSEIGEGVNIGAGTITCNYDGKEKHKTSIGNNAFIGSNTSLVAPVEIGANAIVGAGSVITENVPANDLALARARQINKER